jgi:hypothetical protein
VSENVYVLRVCEQFEVSLDLDDAVAFAEGHLKDSRRIEYLSSISVPSRRWLNLALCFLNLKYPFQCCGAKNETADTRCVDCPMRAHDLRGEVLTK